MVDGKTYLIYLENYLMFKNLAKDDSHNRDDRGAACLRVSWRSHSYQREVTRS